MTNKEILNKLLLSDAYYSSSDLRFNKELGILLNSSELKSFISYKELENDFKEKIELPLVSWNSKKIFWYQSNELMTKLGEFLDYFIDDYKKNNSSYVQRNIKEVVLGVILSELEGTLKIEGVNTTRKQIEAIINNHDSSSENAKIINNMKNGLDYIFNTDSINKNTLKKLYEILSDGCLNEEDILGDSYYRNDMVYISEFNGCPVDKIDECMESLFKYINDNLNSDDPIKRLMVPFIAHYYLVYIHPYFDYNGRTARMVQLWIFILQKSLPILYLSEAINDTKNDYYKALTESRNNQNDISYFLIYMFKIMNNYSIIHKNIEVIKERIESLGETITTNDIQYIKRIIINKNLKWFNQKKFIEFEGLSITKQGALKILNRFENIFL